MCRVNTYNDNDMHPIFLFCYIYHLVGNDFAGKWNDNELQERAKSQYEYLHSNEVIRPRTGDFSSKNRTELVADLTEDYVSYICSGRSPGHHDMEHTAGLLHKISMKELKKIVEEEEGISIEEANDTRPSVIVGIIKHIFADVLETKKLQTREAKKRRTK